jgi:hypothetical protein
MIVNPLFIKMIVRIWGEGERSRTTTTQTKRITGEAKINEYL